MSELAHLGSVVGFLVLGIALRLSRGAQARRRRANLLIAYVLGLSGLAGLTQWDNWPFTSHQIAVGRPRLDTPICMGDFVGVDAAGVEWEVDPYAWSPVYDSILQYWFDLNWEGLAPPQQQAVLRFLLDKAEQARHRLARGERIGFQRRLGAAASPYWLLLPRPTRVSPEPYTGLRVYRVCWTARQLVEGGGRTRTLRAEVAR